MKLLKRYAFVSALALVVLAGVIGAVVYSLRDPAEFTYKGKPLSEYLISMVPGHGNYDTDFQEAKAALIEAGTNAMPVLFRMLRAHDSALRLKLDTVGRKLGLIRKPFTPASLKNQAAAAAFVILGSSRKDYVPELANVYEEQISVDSQLAVIQAIAGIGPPASGLGTPVIVKATIHTNLLVRRMAIHALRAVGVEPEIAVSALTNCVSDSDYCARYFADSLLSEYGSRAGAALPVLEDSLAHSGRSDQSPAARAIKKIDGPTYYRLVAEGKIIESPASQ